LTGPSSIEPLPDKGGVRAIVYQPWMVLACLVVLNALVYLLLMVIPWNLPALQGQVLLNLQRLSVDQPLARWHLVVGFGLLALFYWLAWRSALRVRGWRAWLVVIAGAVLSGTILLCLYPFDAADIFDNIMHGRILGVYGANPFEQVAADFRGDPFYPYSGWRQFPSAYGPGWELLAGLTARLAGDGIVANVLAFKLLGGLFLAGCVSIVASLLRRTAPERALAGTLLLAWNPLILYETLGHGHNDVAMLFWILLAAWWLARERYTLSALALVAGALFKFVPLLLLPAVGLISLRRLPGRAARLRFLVLTAGAAVILVVVVYAPFWHGVGTLQIEHRRGLFTTSLPAVAYALLHDPLGAERAARGVSLAAAAITGISALVLGLRASRSPSWQSFVQAAFAITLFYLLFSCLWFQQWYAIWPLGLVPLLPGRRLAWLGIGFGFAVLSKPLIFEPIWLWPNPLPDRSWLELRLGPSVLAVPWLLALIGLWMGCWSRFCPRRRS
jgi:hypothetical protein